MSGGTEALPDLGKHCQLPDCKQLDFLPFKCLGCHQVFCLEHRSYKSHDCPKSDIISRKVVVCDICSTSIETTGLEKEFEKLILEKHEKSQDCDPKKKKKPRCSVNRCKEILTYSNTSTCKTCQLKVCLNHRFPAAHDCKKGPSVVPAAGAAASGWSRNKFLMAFASRTAKDCADQRSTSSSSSSSAPFPTAAFQC